MNASATLPRVTVHENHRFLVTERGEPFFWMGDTAWELFHRLTLEDADVYFADRSEKRFNVIQGVVLAECDGLNTPNRYEQRPLIDNDPDQPNEEYFKTVDEFIRMAEEYGLYIGLLPTWGDKTTHLWGDNPVVFTPEKAYRYGKFLGERYHDQTNIIWILGGDRPAVYKGRDGGDYDDRLLWREMARGVREGVGPVPMLVTYHPSGGNSTSAWLHEEPWLDMNMMQSGHGGGHDVPVWEKVAYDYNLSPVKPTLDGEPNYEDHPVNPWPKWDPALGYYRDHDVRKQCYRSVFAGACGVTYGHHSVWQMYETWRNPINHPDRDWQAALDRPGARQVQYLRALMESRPYFTRIPDQDLLASDAGEGGEHVQATRDSNGAYAMIYLPVASAVSVKIDRLKGPRVHAQWYDPRSGAWSEIGLFDAAGTRTFTPPKHGLDWVLVFDSTL
jgi:hypothetical protein